MSVDDAIAYFHGTDEDRYRWEGAAYVIGADEFRELLFERQSNEAAGKSSRDPITAFQSRLTKLVMRVINISTNDSKKLKRKNIPSLQSPIRNKKNQDILCYS